ncbi:MAG: hypothetical protein ACR2N3_07625 [Pyrinomonadaceae bacterium]
MFTIKASYSDIFEVEAAVEKVREFLLDVKNFVELMPSIESIHTDAKGITRWTIRAEIPFVGVMKQIFPVELVEEDEDRIEWSPVAGEKQNFLRYAMDLIERGANKTAVKIVQMVELRRSSARDLHTLAGLVSENSISREMNKTVAEMIKIFVRKSRERLEK